MTDLFVDLHSKRHSDFDLNRIVQAQLQGFEKPIIAYLCGAYIGARAGVGVVFDHRRKDKYGRFADGHLIRTSDVQKAEKEDKFWVLTTEHSRYVLATFQRGNGRSSLREFLRLSSVLHPTSPVLQ